MEGWGKGNDEPDGLGKADWKAKNDDDGEKKRLLLPIGCSRNHRGKHLPIAPLNWAKEGE
jgi:hypothetical protein